MSEPSPAANAREIPVFAAVIPILALIGGLYVAIVLFEGSGHIPLVFAGCVAGIIARMYGYGWKLQEQGIVTTISRALGAILILFVIGMLVSSWLAAGVVPALIDWGLKLLRPEYFLPATCLICAVVSLVSGSSWTTAATVGLALMGVGEALGVDRAMAAGAVISGAYFGDKLSPLSDTTNLAPAMAGTDLFTHIRHMLWTTVPALLISLGLYTLLSQNIEAQETGESIAQLSAAIHEAFSPDWWHLAPAGAVLVLVLFRQPALPSLMFGVLLGAIVGMVTQDISLSSMIGIVLNGYQAATGVAEIDALLSHGGMSGMSNTVLLILCAMSFGGIMESTGMLQTLANRILSLARSTGSLIVTTVATCIGVNVIAADQYISIVVPGRMYATAYRQRKLAPKNLSRTLEDGGTITSPLIPWNTCGAYMATTLGVATMAYAPFAFLNLLNPLIAIFYGFTGWTLTKLDESETTDPEKGEAHPTDQGT